MTTRKKTTARRGAPSATTKDPAPTHRPSTTRPPGRPPVTDRRGAPPLWRRRAPVLAAALVPVALAATLIAVLGGSPPSSPLPEGTGAGMVTGPAGPEGVPLEEGVLLAPASTAANGQTVDGVQCNSDEQVAYHVHTHLSVYVNGDLRPLPAGIGIVSPVPEATADGPFDGASRCYYWLHVHAQDGVIHIESPAGHTYTLGQFFDLWGQPLGAGQVGPVKGTVTAFVDGRAIRGDPRTIVLGSHEDIQIDVGTPEIAPKAVDWSRTSL